MYSVGISSSPQLFEGSLKDPEWTWTSVQLLCASKTNTGLEAKWSELQSPSLFCTEVWVPGSLPADSSLPPPPPPCLQWIHRFQGPGVPDHRTELGAQLDPTGEFRTAE